MSTYAIIKTGGKQVKVEVGQAVYVEKLNVEAGQEVTFNEVVLVGGENTVVATVNKVTVNLTLKLSSTLSTLNFRRTHDTSSL